MEVNISDRIGFSTGTVRDISRFGFCVTNLPRKLQMKDNIVVAIVSVRGQQFKLLLRPQWEKQDGLTIAIGMKIDGVPLDWMQMIMKMEYPQGQRSGKNLTAKSLRRGVARGVSA